MLKELLHMVYNFENVTGKKPIGVYLGYNDKMKLLADAEAKYYFQSAPDYFTKRWELNGVPIFFVNAEDHVNVG